MSDNVILVTGSAPPDSCGVGDYTERLASAIAEAGFSVDLLIHRRWDTRGSIRIARQLRRATRSLIHLQYPTMGYGHSLGPQFCALVCPSIVTLHEFSQAHPLRQLSLLPFALRASRLVMTSEFEKQSLLRKMPWTAKHLQVIPIGSNIAPTESIPTAAPQRVLYHGLIMPRKGLEDFIEFARIVRVAGYRWELVALGKIPEKHVAYARALMASSEPHRIRWILDTSAEEATDFLSQGGIAYLPFPDGASERRGSLKSILAAGMPCITTRSIQTPVSLMDTVILAGTPQEAVQQAARLLSSSEDRERLAQSSLRYAQTFSWKMIAEAHIRMYEEIQASTSKHRNA